MIIVQNNGNIKKDVRFNIYDKEQLNENRKKIIEKALLEYKKHIIENSDISASKRKQLGRSYN